MGENSFKIKMFDIINMIESFNKLVEAPLSLSTSMKIMRMQELFIKEHKLFERQKNKLIKEFGEISEDKKEITVKKENLNEFSEKMQELSDIEVVVYSNKIKINELKDNTDKEIFITASDLYKLRHILED